jgi:hypothetical protein
MPQALSTAYGALQASVFQDVFASERFHWRVFHENPLGGISETDLLSLDLREAVEDAGITGLSIVDVHYADGDEWPQIARHELAAVRNGCP